MPSKLTKQYGVGEADPAPYVHQEYPKAIKVDGKEFLARDAEEEAALKGAKKEHK